MLTGALQNTLIKYSMIHVFISNIISHVIALVLYSIGSCFDFFYTKILVVA